MIKRSFEINLYVLRAFRLYPSKQKQTCWYKVQKYLLYFVCSVLICFLMTVQLVIDKSDYDLIEFNLSISYLSAQISAMFKLIPFLVKSDEIKKCVDYLEFCFISTKPRQKKIVDDCSNICRRNSVMFLTLVILCICFFATIPLLFNGSGNKFPINIWLPFNATASFQIYWCIYAFTISAIIYTGSSSFLIDVLITGLACHATGQLKILKDNLRNLNKYVKEMFNNNFKCKDEENKMKVKIMHDQIRQCIDHHDNILKFVKLYESLFSFTIISQFAGSVFTVCFLCLQLIAVTEVFNIMFISCAMYIPAMFGEIFFYCYYGTNLFEENNSLIDDIYMGDWYNYDDESKKALIILMERSKRQMVITAGKIVPLTLDTFATMAKRTYSLLAVMKNFQ